MKQKAPAGLRYLILLLPVIAAAVLVSTQHYIGRTAASSTKKSLGKEQVWHCLVSNTPRFRILDMPHIVVAFPQLKDRKALQSIGALAVTMTTPKDIQSHVVNPAGIDYEYRNRVCTFHQGSQSIDVVDGEFMRIGHTMIPLTTQELYVTFGNNDSPDVSSRPPKWYIGLITRYRPEDKAQIFAEERDVYSDERQVQ